MFFFTGIERLRWMRTTGVFVRVSIWVKGSYIGVLSKVVIAFLRRCIGGGLRIGRG